MHFKHPELLYALFLLVIPVLVHLFQLRRFRTEYFTNVKFLKKVVMQTRKSSRIKKWLILFTRLLLMAAVIIAFAQPFFSSSVKEKGLDNEIVVYLDNSYSMQAKGRNGVLLKNSIQELLENLPPEGRVSLFTNSEQYKDISTSSLRKKLQEISYSPDKLPWKTISLKAEGLFSGAGSAKKNFIAISDFQQEEKEDSPTPLPYAITYLIPQRPENINNVSLDTLYISEAKPDEISLSVGIKATGNAPREVSVGLYNGKNLLSRKTATLQNDTSNLVFTLPSAPLDNGRINIEDTGLSFDDDLFFSINTPPAAEVIVIGDAENGFLKRIFTSPEFQLQVFAENNVDYNTLSRANLVILNELRSIPLSLMNELQKLHSENVYFVIIPSGESDLESYNRFLRSFELPEFSELVTGERMITEIAFSHPVYASVFDDKVENFQYPSVQSYFRTGRTQRQVLSYDNGQPFLMEKDNIFVFSAPLNTGNSSFQGSPLIVPTFFNIGTLTVSLPQLYFVLGKEQTISIQTGMSQDEILKLDSEGSSFIPRQQSFQNKVEITLQDNPGQPGHYRVLKNSAILQTLAFNVDRRESKLQYVDLQPSENLLIQKDIPGVFEEINAVGEVAALWKWFVIFALILLLTEMLILKFFK